MPAIRTISGALILAAAMSTTGPAFAAEPMSLAELAARTGNGAFEYRGIGMSAMGRQENVIWSFTPDGKVKGEVLRIGGGWGAGGHYESRKVTGTWRREGSQLCVQLDPMHARFNGCYGVMTGPGGAVNLTGPVSLEGQLHGGQEPTRATTPGGTVGERPAWKPGVSPRGMPGR